MNDQSSHLPSSQRRGLATALLSALHESRRRQAVREIDKYRHLIDEAKASELASVALRPAPSQSNNYAHPYSTDSATWRMSARAKIVIVAVLLTFAMIHAFAISTVDGTLLMNDPGRSPAKTAHMYRAD